MHHANANTLQSIHITQEEVIDSIKCLKIGKASGPDGIDNRILKETIYQLSYPFCDLFNSCLNTSKMPSCWKIANVCPIFKKGDPSLASNYRPISLLNTIEKVFERILYKHIFNFLRANSFFAPTQSGFLPGDSTVNQLTYMYNTFCKALDNGLEVRVVFFDISKAFDQVWHKGVLCKLQQAGIRGNLLSFLSNYLADRKQLVILPGSHSSPIEILAGVPQGSILGPLMFLVYINDIIADINAHIHLFADDTSLFMVVNSPNTTATVLQSDIDKISSWADKWLVCFNPLKSESMLISRKINKPSHPPLNMQNVNIPIVDVHKHLGVFMSNDCTWHVHISFIKEKAWARVHIMRRLKLMLDRNTLEKIYFSFIRPLIEYSDAVFDNCTQCEKDELEKIQNEAARITSGCTRLVSLEDLYNELGWETISQRRRKHKLILMYKMNTNNVPNYLQSLLPATVGSSNNYSLRNSSHLQTIQARTSLYSNSFLPSTVSEWNNLPDNVKNAESIISFKRLINTNRPIPNILFSYGERRSQLLHTRLRTNCSALNEHLFRRNIITSPLCLCGRHETTSHYFLECTHYVHIRGELFNSISVYSVPCIETILYGDNTRDYLTNTKIADAVHKFIIKSKRFDS